MKRSHHTYIVLLFLFELHFSLQQSCNQNSFTVSKAGTDYLTIDSVGRTTTVTTPLSVTGDTTSDSFVLRGSTGEFLVSTNAAPFASSAADVGMYSSISKNGEVPVISFYDNTNGDLKVRELSLVSTVLVSTITYVLSVNS